MLNYHKRNDILSVINIDDYIIKYYMTRLTRSLNYAKILNFESRTQRNIEIKSLRKYTLKRTKVIRMLISN